MRYSKEAALDKIKKDRIVQYLTEVFKGDSSVSLVGGAITDILDNRPAKDFDLELRGGNEGPEKALLAEGFQMVSTTRTAVTFIKRDLIVQLLRRPSSDFKFTIEAANYNFSFKTLAIDLHSYNNRLLVPNYFAFETRVVNKKEFKVRVKHWKKKNFAISKTSYNSLYRWATSWTFRSFILGLLDRKGES